MRATWASRLGGWLFRPTPATRLGAVRLLVGGYSVYYLARRRRMLARIAKTDPELFAPVGPPRVLGRPLRSSTASRCTDATLAAGAAFTLGAGHRITGPIYSALLTWTLAYRNSWSMVFHNDNLLVLHAIVLGASRCADAVSMDAVARHGWRRAMSAGTVHGRYGWPLQAMNAVTAASYLLAGVAKVEGELGWRWALGGALRRQVAVDGVRKEVFGSAASPLAYLMYRHTEIFTAMAITSLVVELAAPVALISPRTGRLWALAAFGMHWGILAMMKIKFRYHLSGTAYLSFFDMDKLLKWLGIR
ncbi:MAG: hypothetical protein ACRDTF_16305 [Pseudonocardiaceae bacterium]